MSDYDQGRNNGWYWVQTVKDAPWQPALFKDSYWYGGSGLRVNGIHLVGRPVRYEESEESGVVGEISTFDSWWNLVSLERSGGIEAACRKAWNAAINAAIPPSVRLVPRAWWNKLVALCKRIDQEAPNISPEPTHFYGGKIEDVLETLERAAARLDVLEQSDSEARKLFGSLAGYFAMHSSIRALEYHRQINTWFVAYPSCGVITAWVKAGEGSSPGGAVDSVVGHASVDKGTPATEANPPKGGSGVPINPAYFNMQIQLAASELWCAVVLERMRMPQTSFPLEGNTYVSALKADEIVELYQQRFGKVREEI